ncbi:MAG TPA: NAD-dependent succinate-semialdehyde dehydrogenase [Verrucomicrobiae bacterium]|nr:NAD-dependent succinate-semialdehyde dehydrogenase [Verrucomicrobiae bacterium]
MPASAHRIASVNPATTEVVQHFNPHSSAEIQRKLTMAEETFRSYRKTPLAQRAHFLDRAAEVLEQEKSVFARTMTLEMGKPIKAAVQEVEKCAAACRYYATHGPRSLLPEHSPEAGSRKWIQYQPLGPVLAILPWNFPFWQVFRFAAPALLAGNVGLLKHASNVPQCALAIEQLLRRAGFPEGAFQTLLIGSAGVQELIDNPVIRAVTLTGGVDAGSKVAAAAGRQIKKTVLELSGSDPFVVMPSADLDAAVKTGVQARTINNGQSCIAAKRFIVDQTIAAEFERRFVEQMARLKVGDPMDEKTDIGPLATEQVLADLQDQVKQTIAMGATLVLGGNRLSRPGYFFEPTVLTNIPPGSPAHQSEMFGPVASIFRANGIEDAIRIANDTPFGLGASAWTNDEKEQSQFIERLEAGMVFINGMVASEPALPFGGVKRSGYGRELSYHGMREFLNVKTVVVRDSRSGPASNPGSE